MESLWLWNFNDEKALLKAIYELFRKEWKLHQTRRKTSDGFRFDVVPELFGVICQHYIAVVISIALSKC